MADRSVLKFIPINKLKLDPDNPRLPSRLKEGGSTEQSIIDFMLDDASLLDLMASISENGFFNEEPLLGIKSGSDQYTIIEGNRRLSSVKLLSREVQSNAKKITVEKIISEADIENIPTELPVYIFKSQDDIQKYLGYRHVTGVKSWGALAKARYLSKLYKKLPSSISEQNKYRSLAKSIGSKGSYVQKLLTSYRLYEFLDAKSYFGLQPHEIDKLKFSYLHDSATKYLNITEFLNIDFKKDDPLEKLDIKNLEELIQWLYYKNNENETRIGETRNIKYLNAVIGNPKAIKAFRGGASLRESATLTSLPEEIFSKLIQSSLRQVKIAYDNLPEIKEIDETHLEPVDKLSDLLSLIKIVLKDKMNL